MAVISFFTAEDHIENLSGSGIGFFGASFGNSVAVGSYQTTTWITSSTGATQGPQGNNVKFVPTDDANGSGLYGTGQVQAYLKEIPNKWATLNVRFTDTSARTTQNGIVRIFDRGDINAGASGVNTQLAQIIHPWTTEADDGSGNTNWVEALAGNGGSAYNVTLENSPGQLGLNAKANNSDTQHDWYILISASPASIGSKTQFGIYVSLEYL